MKIVCLSDLHGTLPVLPECDLILLAGDYSPHWDFNKESKWFDTEFREWLKDAPAPVVGIAGNHDRTFHLAPHLIPPDLPWEYLQDESLHIQGVNIYGTPWQPSFGFGWAFNGTEDELAQRWKNIPDETDILICHGPPHGYGDGVPTHIMQHHGEAVEEIEHVGSPSLLARIREVKPKLVIYGHIHEGWGRYQDNGVVLANVAMTIGFGKERREPTVFTYPDDFRR